MVENTVKVRKGNVYLTIADTSVERYRAKGFDVVDEHGNVVLESVPNDTATLKAAYTRQLAEIKQLKERIAKLEEQAKETKKTTTKKQ